MDHDQAAADDNERTDDRVVPWHPIPENVISDSGHNERRILESFKSLFFTFFEYYP